MDIITRYSGLKSRALDMARFVAIQSDLSPNRGDLPKIRANLAACASYLVFHDYYTVEQKRLVKAHTCKVSLLCPFCAARRAAKMVQKNISRVEAVMADQPHLVPVMVTLTVKNGPDLVERFNHLRLSLRKLNLRRRHYLAGQRWTEWARIVGAVHSFEITNKGQGWHPHVHMVALVESWIDREALSAEWREITGDSFIVDVRKIRPKDMDRGGLDIATGLVEVFKYSLKFQDMTLEDTWYAFERLKGKRLIDSWGVLRGVQEPDSLLDDPLEGLPYLELVYRFSRASRAYDLVRAEGPEARAEGGEQSQPPGALA